MRHLIQRKDVVPDAQHILETLAGPVRDELLAIGVKPDSCVLMARLCQLVLEHFGAADVEIVPVRFAAANPKLMELRAQNGGRLPTTAQQAIDWKNAGAYMVAIDEAARQPGKLPGHLIVRAGGWWCDPSLDQANRPQHGLILGNWVTRLTSDQGRDLICDNDAGCRVEYQRIDLHPSAWESTPDWTLITPDDPIVSMAVNTCLHTANGPQAAPQAGHRPATTQTPPG